MRLTKRAIKLIKEAFEEAKINPYGCGYNLFCITSYIEKKLPYQKDMDVSRIGTTKSVEWAIEEMKKQKLF